MKPLSFFDFSGKHVFFGYYDLPQINASGNKLLVHIADKNANPARDTAEIGYFDFSRKADGLFTGDYHRLVSTRAWCWQQGARLRWHPLCQDTILYNDSDSDSGSGSGYVTKSLDIKNGATSVIAPALYDMSCDFRYGVHVNFAKLQRLRPGYGYGDGKQKTDEPALDEDGVFLANLSNGELKLIVPLTDFASYGSSREHYINHVSFCPDGSKFIFFHIMGDNSADRLPDGLRKVSLVGKRITNSLCGKSDNKISGRSIELYLYDISISSLKLLEKDSVTSHYCWRNDNELLTTSVKSGVTEYSIYDISAGTRNVIGRDHLRCDGHPTFLSGGGTIISDFYAQGNRRQKLFAFNIDKNEFVILSDLDYMQPKSRDRRCDLHPRVWENGSDILITTDTTCGNGKSRPNGLRKVAVCRYP